MMITNIHRLQYCLEDGVNMLKNEDYVVHLDEETVLTEDAVKGILNFISDNKHVIGQGNNIVLTNVMESLCFITLMLYDFIINIFYLRCNYIWYSTQPGIFELVY